MIVTFASVTSASSTLIPVVAASVTTTFSSRTRGASTVTDPMCQTDGAKFFRPMPRITLPAAWIDIAFCSWLAATVRPWGERPSQRRPAAWST